MPAFSYVGSYIIKHPLRYVTIYFKDRKFEITPEHGTFLYTHNALPQQISTKEIEEIKTSLRGLEGMLWSRESPLLVNGPDKVNIKEEIVKMLDRYSQ